MSVDENMTVRQCGNIAYPSSHGRDAPEVLDQAKPIRILFHLSQLWIKVWIFTSEMPPGMGNNIKVS